MQALSVFRPLDGLLLVPVSVPLKTTCPASFKDGTKKAGSPPDPLSRETAVAIRCGIARDRDDLKRRLAKGACVNNERHQQGLIDCLE